jgi:hypothetical protein
VKRLLLILLAGCATAAPARPPPTHQAASGQIIGSRVTGTPAELSARADVALAAGKWSEAIELLEALRAATKIDVELASRGDARLRRIVDKLPIPMPSILSRLGLAYEGASRLNDAWATYAELEPMPGEEAKAALGRQIFLAAYLVKDVELARLGEKRLADPNVTERGKLAGLAARAIAAAHAGKDAPAMRDTQDGLDISDRIGAGLGGRLPLDVAMLYFALAEVRRVRSERITFEGKTPTEFLPAFTARCTGLLSAQSAYTDAIRSEDPRAAILAGVTLGTVYMRVHHDVLAVPPSKKADTEEKRQIHDAMMRVRYRVLLEKGGDMMDRSLALGAKLHDESPWMEQARVGKAAIAESIAAEHERLKAYPFTEKEVEDALEILRKQTMAKLAAEEERQRKNWPKD